MNHTHGTNFDASKESSHSEIALAKVEGTAYGAALKYLTSVEASDSGSQEIGDYIVAYAIEEAEGLYHMRGGQLEWHEPTDYNCHIEVAVRGAADGRFLPCLNLHAELLDSRGIQVASHPLPFLWHPWIYHYGSNSKVPSAGTYKLRIHIEAPTFPRHDRVNGKRFLEAVDVDFDVKIETGRKLTSAA